VLGWKAYALILAPVSRDPTEGDGIKKKFTNSKMRNRAIQIASSGTKSSWSPPQFDRIHDSAHKYSNRYAMPDGGQLFARYRIKKRIILVVYVSRRVGNIIPNMGNY